MVSIVRCAAYDGEHIDEAIAEVLMPFGGMGAFVSPGDRVLLKPNMLSPAKPERAVTTHPEIVRAVAELVIRAGGLPVVADSPGGLLNGRDPAKVLEVTGIADAARRAGEKTGRPVRLDTSLDSVMMSCPESRVLKQAPVIRVLTEADKVINLCKLKTHAMMTLSGAVKNLFGVVAGRNKTAYHLRYPDYDTFAGMLLDVCRMAAPVLNLMDAVVAMEGMGPGNGTPRNMGLILASPSACHLDLAAAALTGMKPAEVPTLLEAVKRGWAPADAGGLKIRGVALEDAAVKNFKLPWPAPLIRRPLRHFFRLVRPRPKIYPDRCLRCGECVENCPPDAMRMGERAPVIDWKKCICCMCCQELCPHNAIGIQGINLQKKAGAG